MNTEVLARRAVTVDGQDYDLTLRFERNYKPYTLPSIAAGEASKES